MSRSPATAMFEGVTDKAILSFLEVALKAHASLAKSGDVWYRGQANKDWNLLPGLFRSGKSASQEDRAYREWIRRAELIEKPEENEWNHLFNMQHYGVPTRLLDWTESFAVAVGFSLVFSNYGETSVPRVFILDPCALNKKTTGRDRVFEIPEDKTISYRQTYLEGRGIMPTGPVAVRPSSYTLSNRRADNQAGVFTIHDNSGQPVDAQPRDIITSFTIEKKQIPGARLFLKLSNVNAYTIYPDFGGLAGYIRAILTNESK